MTDKSFTLNCPRCGAVLAVPGRPKRDIVVQCSECGHKGRLPRKRKSSTPKPVVLQPASTVAENAAAASGQPVASTPPPATKQRSILTSIVAIAVLSAIAVGEFKFLNRETGDVPETVAEESATSDKVEKSDTDVVEPVEETTNETAEEQPLVVRDLITNEEIFRRVRHDLENDVSRFETLFTRYFTLTHLHNAGVSDEQLDATRHALVKLLNSLSWERELYQPVAIDAEKTIYRVDVRDLKWTQQTWKKVLDYDPYGFSYTNEDAATCADLTDESTPVVRADWFVFAASRPPLYHQILEIPETLNEMASQLRVNIADNIHEAEMIRAGFRESEETLENRIIERHRSPYGALWVSYNFADDNPRRDIFEYPLGPGTGPQEFIHDGAQAIFNLPNGLQAYMTVDKDGHRTDDVSTKIFRESSHRSKHTHGASCITCHASGIIAKADEVGIAVRTNRDAYEAPDFIIELYGDAQTLTDLQRSDQTRFLNAVAKLNLPTATREDEPVLTTSQRFEADLSAIAVAAELGLSVDDLKSQISANTSLKEYFSDLSKAKARISRTHFLASFGKAGEALGFGRSIRRTQVAKYFDTERATRSETASEVAKPKAAQSHPAADAAASTTKTVEKLPPANLFGDGGMTFVSFDGKSVKYKDKAGVTQTVAVDLLSASDQESVLSQSVAGSNGPSDLPDDTSTTSTTATTTPPPTSKPRAEALITTGKAKFISFDGRQNVRIQHSDGRSETVLIDTLNSADIEFVLQQNSTGSTAAVASSSDLPGPAAETNTSPSTSQPPPATGNPNVWHGVDNMPIIEGTLHSFEPSRGLVRISPVSRTWYPNGQPFEGLFHIAADIGDSVEVQVRPEGAGRSQKFDMASLNQDDQAYLNMIRRGLESGQMKAVRSASLKYWQIPIGAFSPSDQQRILRESGVPQP